MDNNIVKVGFGPGRNARTRTLYQWDHGMLLEFVGINLPDTYTVHFSNNSSAGSAKTQIGGAGGVSIPDEYLTTGLYVYAWVYLHSGEDDGETVYTVTIPVAQRPRPTDDPPTPVQQELIEQAIAALNAGVGAVDGALATVQATVDAALKAAKDSGEFDGPPGEPGKSGFEVAIVGNGVVFSKITE